MTDDTRDPKISQRYRELGGEEPPHALDAAILAAARRAAGARPAPLVAPAGRRRWYFPLAAAAVIMLSVAVTLQVERERPDAAAPPASRSETTTGPAAQAPAPAQEKSAAAALAREQERPLVARPGAAQRSAVTGVEPAKPAIESRRFAPDPGPPAAIPSPPASPAAPAAQAPTPAAKAAEPRAEDASGAASSVAGTLSGAPAARETRDSVGRGRADRPAAMDAAAKRAEEAVETPERQLERIAEMRRRGRHDEADKALAEFRKRYPEYRISEAMLEKVRPSR